MSTFPVAAIKQFVRKPSAAAVRCETCAELLQPDHEHLFDPLRRVLRCCCLSCTFTQHGVYRRIPKSTRLLSDFVISDQQWHALGIPVALAFCYRTPDEMIAAEYPGPAGVLQSSIPTDTWNELCLRNPALQALLPNVQALLVNRIDTHHQYFIAPIDACYRLSGLIRRHWRGFSGGPMAWMHIAQFFADLAAKTEPPC